MRTRFLLAAVVLGLTALTATAGDTAVRTLDLKGLKLGNPKGKVSQPTVITSAEELAAAVADEDAQKKIKDQVDFTKEKLLYFVWAGSGGDKLSFASDKGDKGLEVTVTLKPGLTNDLRQHRHMVAIPKDATWKFAQGKPGK
jgi:hypothetical protein